MEQKEIVIPKGWEIDKIEDNKIILKESKKELPKTWEECYKQLGHGEYLSNTSDICKYKFEIPDKCNCNALPIGLSKPMLALCQLLVCREVYRQGWKPDWSGEEGKYGISIEHNNIYKGKWFHIQCLLSFQSEEIRDEFLNNFRDLIEEAKELL